jgi:hypothetical protein
MALATQYSVIGSMRLLTGRGDWVRLNNQRYLPIDLEQYLSHLD